MESCLPLYSAVAPPHPGRLLLTCLAQKQQEGEVSLAFSESCIAETGNRGKNYIYFDFDVKYAFLVSPPTLVFEKGEEKYSYILRSDLDLKQCR